jgi:hypothetical protein
MKDSGRKRYTINRGGVWLVPKELWSEAGRKLARFEDAEENADIKRYCQALKKQVEAWTKLGHMGKAAVLKEIMAKLIQLSSPWIPCSKRLPEIDEDGFSEKVLACFSNYGDVVILEYRVEGGTGKWYAGDSDESPEDIGIEVIAWMPRPAPYRPEE